MQEQNPMKPLIDITRGPQRSPAELLNEKIRQSLEMQRQDVSDTRSQLKGLQEAPKQKDMSALFAMGDILSNSGGKYSKMYQAFKPKDTSQQEMYLKSLMSRQQQALTDDEIKLLKSQADAGNSSSTMAQGLTKGQEAMDKAFGKEYTDFFAKGGYADAEKGLAQLREVSGKLETSDDITGPLVGSLPPFLKRRFAPEAAATQQAVEEVVQRNLRLILGAQFTEREGTRLIERAYDPALSEVENKKRVDRLIKSIEGSVNAKQIAGEYFEKHGTLKGYKGSTRGMTVDEAINIMDGEKPSGGSRYEELKKKYGY